MDNLVFLLPNGRLSNGNYVRKFTKTQLRAARVISRIPAEFRESLMGYVELLNQKNEKPRHIVPQKY